MLQRPPHRPDEARRRRHARFKARQRAGVMTAIVEIDGVGLNWLIRWNHLDPHDIDGADPRAVRAAVGAAITRLISISSQAE